MVKKIKGTQDFLDLSLFNFIATAAREHLAIHHFTEIKTPILEATELFKRSLGVQTDVVTKEMFTIAQKESICLRPELTAATVRAFIENKVQQTPWKVFSIGPAFRYERPQKGRFRQFHQLNIEIIGSDSISQDVGLIAMLDRFFHEKLKLTNGALLINFLGCPDDRKAFRILLAEFLNNLPGDICDTCKVRKDTNIMRVFDCKNPDCQKLYRNAPRMTDNLCDGCGQEWQILQDQLQLLSVSFSVDHTLVRGLDYYSKTVFEFVSDNLGAQSSICGGGRYNQLVSQLGGAKDQPSIGVAIGIERLLLLLEQNRSELPLPSAPALHVILPMTKQHHSLALVLAGTLQANNLCTDILLEGNSLKSMMRTANKLGAKYSLILGDQEQIDGTVTVKNMMTSESKIIKQVDLSSYLAG
ncbi:histidine--tRNA ligase [bacterium]|nr:histidine--tRNA ligase [bacterium]